MRGTQFVSVRDALPGDIPAQAQAVDCKMSQYRGLGKVSAWPPAHLTANTTTLTGQAYGNGTYVASASSQNSTFAAWYAFDTITENNVFSFWACEPNYNASTGVYNNTVSTVVNGAVVHGEWIQIQLPLPISLTGFQFRAREDTLLHAYRRLPQSFVLAGSSDGVTWISLLEQTDFKYTELCTTFTLVNNTIGFPFYRLIAKSVGNIEEVQWRDQVHLGEWTLYGTARPGAPAASMYNPRMWLRMEDLQGLDDGAEIQQWPAAFEGGPVAQAYKVGTAGLPRLVRPPGGAMGYVQLGTNTNDTNITIGNYFDFGPQTFNIGDTGGMTGFMVYRFRSLPGNWCRLMEFGAGEATNNVYLTRFSSNMNLTIVDQTAGTSSQFTNTINVGVWQVVTFRLQKDETRLWLEGTIASQTPTYTPANKTFTKCFINNTHWNGTSIGNMDLREFLVYDYALTDAQVESVRAYLMTKSDVVAIDRTLNGLLAFDRDVLLDEEARYTATVTGTVSYAAGPTGRGQAMVISRNTLGGSATNHVTYSVASSISTVNGFTFAQWVHPTATLNATGRIITSALVNPLYTDTNGIYFAYDNNQVLNSVTLTGWRVICQDANTTFKGVGLSTTPENILNKWTHLAATISGTTMTFYVDAVLVGTVTLTSGSQTLSTLQLARNANSNTQSFNGLIDDVRVYTRALTASDIAALVGTANITRIPNGQRGLITFDDKTVRVYPPTPMTSNSTAISAATYGNGTYVASASADMFYLSAFNAFDGNHTMYPAWGGFLDNSGTPNGTYTTALASGGSVVGSWVQLQMPVAIVLRSIVFTTAEDAATPTSYTVVGSNDGSSWVSLFSGSNGLSSSVAAQTTLTISNLTTAYTYFRFIITGKPTTSNNNAATIGDLSFYGEDILLDARGGYTVSGTPTVTYTTGVRNTGRAVVISGNTWGGAATNSVSYTAGSTFSTSNGCTFACWVYPTQTPTASTRSMVACLTNTGYTENIGLFFVYDENITVNTNETLTGWRVGFQQSNVSYKYAGIAVPAASVANRWTHLAGTISGTTLTLFLNGQQVKTDTLTSGSQTMGDLWLGRNPYQNIQSFNGRIHDVQIYTRALSAHEIAQLCNPVTFSHFGFEDSLVDARGIYTSTVTGSISYTSSVRTGAIGKALSISGNTVGSTPTNYILYNGPTMTTANGFTKTLWVYPTSTPSSGNLMIITSLQGVFSDPNGLLIGYFNNASGTTGWRAVAQTSSDVTPDVKTSVTPSSALNTWTHLALTISGTTMTFYVNGVAATPSATVSTLTLSNLGLGYYLGASPSAAFNGLIDDLQIHTRALSAAEISALYNAKSTIITSIPYDEELRGRITFDGESPADERGAYYPSTVNNVSYTSEVPSGLSGKSLVISENPIGGTATSYINYTAASTFTTTNGGTISTWVYPTAVPSSGSTMCMLDTGGVILAYYRTSGTDRWITAQDTEYNIATTSILSKWTHLAVSITSSQVNLFVNGVLAASKATSTAFSIGNVTLGSFTNLASAFNGYLKDIRVYSRALVPSEIAALARTTIAPVMSLPFTPDTALRACITGDNGISSNSLGLAYPPAAMSANSVTISGQRYGNGAYVASASSTASFASTLLAANRVFNKIYDGNATTLDMWQSASNYIASTGLPSGAATTSVSVLGTVTGEWIQIQLPQAITLASYTITPRNDVNFAQQSPQAFVLVGSADGTTWASVDSRTAITWTTASQTFYVTGITASYSYYRLITTVVGNDGQTTVRDSVNIAEWELFAVPSSTARFVAEYPPAAMTANSTALSTAAYGPGSYVASASTEFSTSWQSFQAFDKTVSDTKAWISAVKYVSATGLPSSAATTVVNGSIVSGEYVQIQLPSSISVSSYMVVGARSTVIAQRSPQSFVLVGSTDGTNWVSIDDQVNLVWTTQSRTFNVIGNVGAYIYYRLIIRIVGNNGADTTSAGRESAECVELRLYGAPAPAPSEWPPSAMSANTTTINGQVYVASASTTYSTIYQAFNAFDTNSSTRWVCSGVGGTAPNNVDVYNNTTGAYTGSVSTTVSGSAVNGEWLQIQLPSSIAISTYAITPESSRFAHRSPQSFILAGSNNGSTWFTVADRTGVTNWTSASQTFGVASNATYRYYRLIVRIIGNNSALQSFDKVIVDIARLQLYGTSGDLLNPIDDRGIFTPVASQNVSLGLGPPSRKSSSHSAIVLSGNPTQPAIDAEWPPSAMTANSSTISDLTYVASASSVLGTSWEIWRAFNKLESDGWHSASTYSLTTGAAIVETAPTTTVSGTTLNGEWLQIQLPTSVALGYYTIVPRTNLEPQRSPSTFTVAGSNDGSTWFTVDSRSGLVWDSNTKTFNMTSYSSASYRYYRLITTVVGNSAVGTDKGSVQIMEWRLYGTEFSQITSSMDFSSASLSTANGFTMAMWVNPTEIPSSGVRAFVATTRGTFEPDQNGIALVYSNNGPNASVVGWAAIVQAASGTRVTPIMAASNVTNTWTHLALTISGTTVTLYVNGVASTPQTHTKNINITVTNLRLGYNAYQAGRNEGFNGRIDDILVYQRALSAAEIAQIAGLNGNATAILDFDASDLALGTVSTWANRGSLGSAFNATGGGTNMPVVRTDTLGKFVYFDESFFTVGTSGLSWTYDAAGTQGHTFVVVASMKNVVPTASSGSSNFERLIDFSTSPGNNTGNTNAILLYRDGGASSIVYGVWSSTMNLSSQEVAVGSGAFNNNVRVFIGVSSQSAGTLYIDGVSTGTPSAGTVAGRTTTMNYIGRSGFGTVDAHLKDASIRQVIIYNRPFTAAQVSTLTQQLRYKWGIGQEKLIANKITTNTPLLWIRSDEIAGLPTDTALSTWPSALGSNATGNKAGTASLPLVKRDGGRAYVRLGTPGANNDITNGNWFDFGSQLFRLSTNGGFTMVCMVRFYSSTAGLFERLIDFGSGGPNNNITMGRHLTNTTMYATLINVSTYVADLASKPDIPTSWQVVAYRVIPNELAVWVGTDKRTKAGAIMTDRTLTGTFIGKSQWGGDNSYANLDIREMMVFDRGLSDAEIGNLRTYLTNKYR